MEPLRPPRPPRPGRPHREDDPPRPPAPPPPVQAGERQATEAHAADGRRQFACGQCGGKLVFAPGEEALRCEYCGFVNEIAPSAAHVAELDLQSHLALLSDSAETEEHITAHCGGCGANVDKPPELATFECPFCGATLNTDAQSRRLIKPSAMLPFAIERDESRARFLAWLRSRWFAPSGLIKRARIEAGLRGVYVPFWTYNADTETDYTGERGEHYWVTVGSGKNQRRVRKTRWYWASGDVRVRFRNVLVLGSRSLPTRLAEALEPWDLASLVPYDAAYISGFTAENYQIDLVEGFSVAQDRMHDEIVVAVRYDIGGDEQRIYSMDTRYDNLTFKHILLPVWISAYRFKGRVYRFLVNARTGEVQGERPWSILKITLLILAILLVLLGVAWWLEVPLPWLGSGYSMVAPSPAGAGVLTRLAS